MLPYPGRYESNASWDRRCDEYERNQRDWRRQQAARNTNWGGNNYIPVQKNVEYIFPDGRKVLAHRVIVGDSRSRSARDAAAKKGLKFEKVYLAGKTVITSRTEYVFYKENVGAVESSI